MEFENLTIADAVISIGIATGKLDETNPQLVRILAKRAVDKGLIANVTDFYFKEFSADVNGEYIELDSIVERLDFV